MTAFIQSIITLKKKTKTQSFEQVVFTKKYILNFNFNVMDPIAKELRKIREMIVRDSSV